MDTKAEKKGSLKLSLVILALLAVIGIACWVLQLTKGLQLTNLNNYETWGLYIIGFVMFTGIAAGSLIFSSSAYLFKSMSEFKPYTRISSFVGAIGGVIAAGLFIFVDIGNPERAWLIILSAKITSPMFWDTLILTVYVIIGIYFTRQLILVNQGEKEEKSLYVISLIAFIAGLLVTVTSFVFSLQVARPLWNNPVQPLSFLAAAIVMAMVLLIMIFAGLNKSGYIQISGEKLAKLAKIAGIFLFVELLIVLGEVIIGLYPGSGEDYVILQWLVVGKGAPFFWVELIAIIVALGLLFNKKPGMLIVGAAVAMFAVFMIKYNLLQAQLLNPLINYAGPPGYGGGEGVYLPSLVEIGLAVGIISFGALLVALGLNKLSLGNKSNKGVVNLNYTPKSEKA